MELKLIEEQTIYLVTEDHAAVTEWGWRVERENADRPVRFVRGRKSQTFGALYDEFAAALQFPDYFGENWNAFAECVGDLSWLSEYSCVVIILDADKLLLKEDPEDSVALIRILSDVRANHAIELQSIEDVNKDLKFFVVFQCAKECYDAFASKLRAAGVQF